MKITRTRLRAYLHAAALAFGGQVRIEERAEIGGTKYAIAWSGGSALPGNEASQLYAQLVKAESAAAVLNALHVEGVWHKEDHILTTPRTYDETQKSLQKWMREEQIDNLERFVRQGEVRQ